MPAVFFRGLRWRCSSNWRTWTRQIQPAEFLSSKSHTRPSSISHRYQHVTKWAQSSPYARLMRLDKPIGAWLLFLPCSWSIALGSPSIGVGVVNMIAFGAGSVLLRGAGCTINDLWDRKIDTKVSRTAQRPIAAGEITPRAALAFFGAQCLAGLPILLSMNAATIKLGVFSLVPVTLYPLAKRVTAWPQAVLGLTFNMGALMGWSAVTGELAPTAWLLYAGSFLWTQTYDTIYAHADKKDDVSLGIGSSALVLGDRTKVALTAFTVGQYGCLSIAGYCAGIAPLYFTALLLPAHLQLLMQIWTTDLDNPSSCTKSFQSNRNIGLVVLAAILVARCAKRPPLTGEQSDHHSAAPEAATRN